MREGVANNRTRTTLDTVLSLQGPVSSLYPRQNGCCRNNGVFCVPVLYRADNYCYWVPLVSNDHWSVES